MNIYKVVVEDVGYPGPRTTSCCGFIPMSLFVDRSHSAWSEPSEHNSKRAVVPEHIKLLEMTWDDTRKLILERRTQLEKLSELVDEYERTFVSVESALKHADKVLSDAETQKHFTADQVTNHLQKLKVMIVVVSLRTWLVAKAFSQDVNEVFEPPRPCIN